MTEKSKRELSILAILATTRILVARALLSVDSYEKLYYRCVCRDLRFS